MTGETHSIPYKWLPHGGVGTTATIGRPNLSTEAIHTS